VAVRDLVVHPRDNDLILATHGRGIWILDDITAVQQAAAAADGGDPLVYQPRPAVRYQMWQKDGNLGQRTFTASNPPYGALIYYRLARLASESKDGVSITITEKSGRVVREIGNAPAAAGVNRAVWDLRYTGAARTTSERFGEGGPIKGPLVVPGEYTVRVQVGASTQTRALQVDSDPRITISLADVQGERDALLSLRDMTARINTVIDRAADLAQQLAPLGDQFKRSSAASVTGDNGAHSSDGATQLTGAAAAVAQLQQHLDSLLAPLTRAFPEIRSMHRWPPGLRDEVGSSAAAIELATAPLTEPQQARLKELAEATNEVVAEMNGIVDREVPKLNRALSSQPRPVPGPAIR
jgi:hypothetical protein